jgi:hypothetical protein
MEEFDYVLFEKITESGLIKRVQESISSIIVFLINYL